jgi:hypothetical protein
LREGLIASGSREGGGMALKENQLSATLAWSHTDNLLAAGTAAGSIDVSFSSSPSLQVRSVCNATRPRRLFRTRNPKIKLIIVYQCFWLTIGVVFTPFMICVCTELYGLVIRVRPESLDLSWRGCSPCRSSKLYKLLHLSGPGYSSWGAVGASSIEAP